MTGGQRMMLLMSLFFFFGMLLLVMVDFGGKKTSALMRGDLPESVLSYPEELAADARRQIPCYTGEKDQQFSAHLSAGNYQLAVDGVMDNNERMEIYVRHDGDYIVLVKGQDSAGVMETCQVAQGSRFAAK